MAISAKHPILDVWQGSDFDSGLLHLLCCGSKGYTWKNWYMPNIYSLQAENFPLFWIHTWKCNIQAKEKVINHWFWCFCSLFYFLHSTVPDNKCDKQKWYVLSFTCIKTVVHVLKCTRAVSHIKWRRLPLSHKGKEML